MQSNAVRKERYDATYNSSVAYDTSRFDKRRRVREALENERVAVPEIKPRGTTAAAAAAKAAAKTNAGVAAHISPFAVVSCVAVLALIFLILFNNVKLNELYIESANLTGELTQLKNDEALLKVKYERKMNLHDIEQAAYSMGFSSPQGDQVVYVDISRPDRAVIVREAEAEQGFLTGLKTIFMAVADFIR